MYKKDKFFIYLFSILLSIYSNNNTGYYIMKIDYQTKIEQYSLVSFNNMKYTCIICCLYTGFSHSPELEYEIYCKPKSSKAF